MNKWNGYFGIGTVILFAVFLSTVFLARNGHGNPVVAGTQISVSPRVADNAVRTRGAVSPCATEDVVESLTTMSPHSQPMQTSKANKPSPQSLAPKSKFSNPPSPPPNPSAGNTPADHPEIIQKMQKLQMPFIANEGQVDESVAFYAKTFGGTVFVTKDGEIVYALPSSGRDVPAGASQVQDGGMGAERQGGKAWKQDAEIRIQKCRGELHSPNHARCRDTVPVSPPIQYLAYVIYSSQGDAGYRRNVHRASWIMCHGLGVVRRIAG